MPAWVKNEDKWEKAKDIVKKQKDKSESDFVDQDWGLVTHIYKNMGGKVGEKNAMKKTAFARYNGLIEVGRKFSALMVPMAKYVLTKEMTVNPPKIATGGEFTKKVGLTDVPVDLGKTAACINSLTAIYDNMIICANMHYDDFVINVYADQRDKAKEWQERFEKNLVANNQYRGKNLYAADWNLTFADVPQVNWDDVVLTEKARKDIQLNTVAFLGDKKLATAGVTRRGIMMYGPPGTGKTSVVKAVFRELEDKGVSRIHVTAESFRKMEMSALFNIISYLGPTVLAFEDIDMVGGGNRDVINVSSNLLGDLLTNLDGMRHHREPLVVMASTNKLEHLDAALTNRAGRFDRKIEVGLPDAERLQKIYFKNLGSNASDDVIKLSEGFTGAHVVETVNTAKILAAHEGKMAIDCLHEACMIVRENFFPGQDTLEMKASVQAHLIKKGFKSGMKKTASKIDSIVEKIWQNK